MFATVLLAIVTLILLIIYLVVGQHTRKTPPGNQSYFLSIILSHVSRHLTKLVYGSLYTKSVFFFNNFYVTFISDIQYS